MTLISKLIRLSIEEIKVRVGDIDKFKILIVSSDSETRDRATSILENARYEVIALNTLEDFLPLSQKEMPDLIIFDSSLPDAINTIRKIKEDPILNLVPILMIIERGVTVDPYLAVGAEEYVEKPVESALLLRRVNLLLRVKFLSDEVRSAEKTLLTLAQLVEMRDAYSSEHIHKVASIALRIGEALNLDDKTLQDLRMGALLHDIGKIGVSEFILRKPGKLTPQEFEEVKKHPIIGENICKPLTSLRGALPAIRHHHERWDGSGYPDGLAQEEIPLIARIVSVADAFVSFTSDRPYRRAYSTQEALSILVGGAGSYWDPSVIWALLKKLS